MKRVALGLVLTACVALQAGCGKKAADEIDFGVIEKSVYRNAYLGFRIRLPDGWIIQDQQAQRKITEAGAKLVAGDDKNLNAMLKASEQQTVQLFGAFRHPIGAPVRFNPNIGCVAERVSHMPGITTGKDYHFHSRRMLEASQLKLSFPREVSSERLGGKGFDVMHVEISLANMVIRQKHYASIIRGYALVCVTTFNTPEDESALNAVVGSMTF